MMTVEVDDANDDCHDDVLDVDVVAIFVQVIEHSNHDHGFHLRLHLHSSAGAEELLPLEDLCLNRKKKPISVSVLVPPGEAEGRSQCLYV